MTNNASKNKSLILLCVLMAVTLSLRCLNDIFIYPAIMLGLAAVLLTNIETGYYVLLFVLPFSMIYKISPEGISFFTIIFALYVVKTVFILGKIRIKFVFLLLLLVAYNLLFSGISKVIEIATMALGMVLIHQSDFFDKDNFPSAIYALSFGLIMTSILALFQTELPLISPYINVVDGIYNGEEAVEGIRFAGLSYNPNYYAFDVAFALSCLGVMIVKDRKKLPMLLFLALSIFAFMSISKTFLIVWLSLIAVLLINVLKEKPQLIVPTIFALLIGVFIVFYMVPDVINLYMERFRGADTQSLSQFTTSRSTIWMKYIENIFDDFKTLFFGKGINELCVVGGKPRASHNAYIEIIYALGLTGSILYFMTIISARSKQKGIKGSKVLLMPLFVLAVNLMAIDFVFYDYSLHYITLFFFLMKYYKAREKVEA